MAVIGTVLFSFGLGYYTSQLLIHSQPVATLMDVCSVGALANAFIIVTLNPKNLL